MNTECWPTDFIWQGPVLPPATWEKPGIVMFFNLECPACVSRGIPLFKRLAKTYEGKLELLFIHTAFGHKQYARDEVVPTLLHFARDFAKLDYAIALDLDGQIAKSWEVLGTPHWLVFDKARLIRSIFGSQDNAQDRLGYLLAELLDKDFNHD